MKAAIIAAGLGERLQQAGIDTPKPLVPIAGKPLIDHVLTAVTQAGIRLVACIVNEIQHGVEEHCRSNWPHVQFDFVRRTTPSSMESLFALSPFLSGESFALLTVDSIVAPSALSEFLQGARALPDPQGVLAVNDFVDDEKPLWARVAHDGRIVALGPEARDGGLVTAGFYYFDPVIFAEVEAARRNRFTALRQFLGHLLERGYILHGLTVPKTVDVDRPEDIAVAETFVRSGYGTLTPTPSRGNAGEGGPALMFDFIGLKRERVYSPGRESDDAAILEAVAGELRDKGHHVVVADGDDEEWPSPGPSTLVFAMAQGPRALEHMEAWTRAGVRVINHPEAILNCQRHRTVPRLQAAEVGFPSTVLVDTNSASLPPWAREQPVWIKRGDVHATEEGDVRFATEEAQVVEALRQLHARGVRQAAIQLHVAGPVLKFYGVRDAFFHCVENAAVKLEVSLLTRLELIAQRAARALGVEIFGGDCVLARDGRLHVIDLNDWPSYRACRAAAAVAIASYLHRQKVERAS